MFEMGGAAYNSGRKDGMVRVVGKLSRKTDVVETLKKALGEQDVETGDAGTSHQVSRMNDGYDRLSCVGRFGFTLCCVKLKWLYNVRVVVMRIVYSHVRSDRLTGYCVLLTRLCSALEVYNVYFTLSTMFLCIGGHEVVIRSKVLIVYF
ncbi:hypothetical protein Hanom_Chr01g00023881 [Helianthus anomalus]